MSRKTLAQPTHLAKIFARVARQMYFNCCDLLFACPDLTNADYSTIPRTEREKEDASVI